MHLARNQYFTDQICANSTLCSGPYKSAVFRSTHQNDLKLGQCLDVDDITSPTKCGDVPWPNLNFTASPVFCRNAFYILVC